MTVDDDDPRHLQVARALQHEYEQKWLACRTRCSALVTDNDQLRAEVLALKQERDGANRRGFDSGRAVGREDVGKYARAIGEIEGLVGITGAVPLRDTVAAVRALQQSLTSARESERRLRERVTQALDDLAEADAWLHPGEPKDAVARARKALTDDPPGQEGET